MVKKTKKGKQMLENKKVLREKGISKMKKNTNSRRIPNSQSSSDHYRLVQSSIVSGGNFSIGGKGQNVIPSACKIYFCNNKKN